MRKFWMGFGLCYLMGIVASMNNVAAIPATTTAGMIYAGVLWAPLNLLPDAMAVRLIPDWAFDFSEENPDAEAMKIKTAALAGNAKLVEYEAVQKWDGHLPQQMFGGATPFINVK